RGARPRLVSTRPAPEPHRRASVLRHDGRAWHRTWPAGAGFLDDCSPVAAGAKEPPAALVSRRRRSGRCGHDGSRLVRDRVRAPALGRVRNHPHRCRCRPGPWTRHRVHRVLGRLRRSGGDPCEAAPTVGETQSRTRRARAGDRRVSAGDAAAALLWLSLTAYAVLGGADFGGGVWDIFASGPRKQAQRRAVATAMGPVWEANHVWLIFMITGLFTTFPIAFSSLSIALFVPATIALLGIVLRGAAFAFRAHGREAVGPTSRWGIVFGGSNIDTAFFLGAAAAAVATGSIRITEGKVVSGFGAGWTTGFAILIGLLAVALCAYLAAAYLMVETEDDPALQADFRARALV